MQGRKWLLVPWISVMFMMALQTMAGSGIFIYDLVKGAVKITTSEGLIWVISVFVSVGTVNRIRLAPLFEKFF